MNFQRIWAFSKKNAIELFNDKFSIAFITLFPFIFFIVYMVLGLKIPEVNQQLYFYKSFTISILFSAVIICLYLITAISKDKKTGILKRIAIAPIKSSEIIIGYAIPYLLISYFQFIFMSIISFSFGMKFHPLFLINFVTLLPIFLFFISFSILFGAIISEKMAGLGGLFLTASIFLFTPYFLKISIDSISPISIISYILPFANIYDSIFRATSGELSYIWINIIILTIYSCLLIWGSGKVLNAVLKKK